MTATHKRMDLRYAAAIVGFAVVVASTVVLAQGNPGYLSVKEFGAKGDGKTDDTKALQAALDTQNESKGNGQASVYYNSTKTLFFPAGRYRITGTLSAGAYAVLLGERAIIEQTDPSSDSLKASGYRNEFSGLMFLGGRRAIVLNTNNVDTCTPKITSCQFYHLTGPAIETEEPSNSTLLVIRDCLFIQCDQVLVARCDKAVVQDCWVTSRREMKDKAVFENRGRLHIERVLGVPGVNRDNDQRWIDNYGSISCVGVRFGGEGAGFCAINNYASYDYTYPVTPSFILLDDCDIYALGNPKRKAAIYCNEIPNQIIVRANHGFADLPLIQIDDKIDLDTYFAPAKQRSFGNLKYYIEDSNVELRSGCGALPEQMRRWQSGTESPPPKPEVSSDDH